MNNMKAQHIKKPIISVVMATYNGEAYISEAIQSVLDQTYSNFEFIIVDDGSTDETAAIISSFNDQRIVYIKKANNTGIADSLNLGISKSLGKYIARMDDDDRCLPERFEKQLQVFKEDKEVILCATAVYGTHSKVYPVPETHERIKMCLLFNNPIFHPTVMMKREVAIYNTYNPNMVPAEDYDLWSRLIFKGKFQMINEPLLYFSGRQSSETGRRRKEQLQLNIKIATFIYDLLGLKKLEGHPVHLANLVSHNYTISPNQLKGLLYWVQDLKLENEQNKWSNTTFFNTLIDNKLSYFIISYFSNNNTQKKITSFLSLNFYYRHKIMVYYLKKYFGV